LFLLIFLFCQELPSCDVQAATTSLKHTQQCRELDGREDDGLRVGCDGDLSLELLKRRDVGMHDHRTFPEQSQPRIQYCFGHLGGH
jgi:hypothetical protein